MIPVFRRARLRITASQRPERERHGDAKSAADLQARRNAAAEVYNRALPKQHKVVRFRGHSVGRLRPVGTLYDKPDVTHRFPVIEPHALELVDRHGSISPGGVGKQNTVPHHAAENDEVVVAEGVDGHHERRLLYQVAQLELTKTLTPVEAPAAIGLQVTLEIEEGEAFADLYEVGMLDVFSATHQGVGNFLFGNGLAKLIA